MRIYVIVALLLLAGAAFGQLVVSPEEIIGNGERGDVTNKQLMFSNTGANEMDIELMSSRDIRLVPDSFELGSGEEQEVVVRSTVPLFTSGDEFEDSINVYIDGEEDVSIPVRLSITALDDTGEILSVVLGEFSEQTNELSNLLESKTGLFSVADEDEGIGGMPVGTIFAIILVIVGVHYIYKKKRNYVILCGVAIAIIVILMGGRMM